ncbi:hypothetical protein YDYSY3_57200 [Paenibacillus chitinolyticus]|uniref:hypothetical protein n=1 Tax=Paenibacillus chitinolyticus TaxID=79263 RepID=UPI0026E4FCDE|nr:hypothetical protein [Paenibacillus chitinolyticus]GKS14720.1 hypothetical protein YDYSY3_57200 [Paenibacillus chitinolyticus]
MTTNGRDRLTAVSAARFSPALEAALATRPVFPSREKLAYLSSAAAGLSLRVKRRVNGFDSPSQDAAKRARELRASWPNFFRYP